MSVLYGCKRASRSRQTRLPVAVVLCVALLALGLVYGAGTAFAAGVPSFGHQQVLATVETASAEAQIDPEGSATTCSVQYVAQATFAVSGWAQAATQPCVEGLGAGSSERLALAEIAGLSIATTYDYRFLASNPAGSATGPQGTFLTFGVESFSLAATDLEGDPLMQAGAHPYELVTRILLDVNPAERMAEEGGGPVPFGELATLKDVHVQVPAGLIGNPAAVPKCTQALAEVFKCLPDEQVGTMELESNQLLPDGEYENLGTKPLFDVAAPNGVAAQFSVRFSNFANAIIDVHLRSGSDYGVDADSLNITSLAPLRSIVVRFWGVPAAASHTPERACVNPTGGSYTVGCASDVPRRPFLSMPSSCSSPTEASMSADAYQQPGVFTPPVVDTMPAVTGCASVAFAPSFEALTTSHAVDSPTGLDLGLRVPQDQNPEGLASADLKNATVQFPPGLVVDPSSADGLAACSEAQVGFTGYAELSKTGEPGVQTPQFTPSPAQCPDASKLGTVQVHTPLLEHPVPGALYLAHQRENPFGSLLAVYLTLYDPISGVVAKLPGLLQANPQTGQLTATFDQNPQLPFEDLKVSLFEGSRAALTTPSACGSYTTQTTLVPWSSPEAPSASPASTFTLAEGAAGGGCVESEAQASNAPAFEAGMASPVAGSYSPFVLKLSREDGSQRFGALGVTLPPGLIGKVAGVQECPQADIEAAQRRDREGEGALELADPSCPAGSELGTVHVGVGSGAPMYVTGKAYFAGPYAGGPFSLVIVTPAIAGPFDLGTVVVRAALYIDPVTAQVTVRSDPFPSIIDGIPLDIRSVQVDVSRPGFMLNPTSCETTAVTGQETSTAGQTAGLSDRFQAGGCTNMPFKPSLEVSASGRVSHLDGTSVQFKLSYPPGALGKEAWLRAAKFEFPKQLSARFGTIQKSCPAATFAANPAGCPGPATIGTATVKSELLPVPLSGPVYFVSNGSAKFPEAVFVLQGDGVTVALHSETFINETTGVTSATLPAIPGVPFEEATVTLPAGPYSEFTGIGNLCKPTKTVAVKKKVTVNVKGHRRKVTRTVKETVPTALVLPTGFIGQNGASISQDTPIAITECPTAGAAKHNTAGKPRRKRPSAKHGHAGKRGTNKRRHRTS